jgi:branched-chain amino acid transport system substrate-binding protein
MKVGFMCSCTGAFGAFIAPGEKVYKAWVNMVNASGGINGHTIDLVTEDDGSVPGNGVTDANSLLSQGVVAIVDQSITTDAWASAVQAAKVPVVGSNSSEAPFATNSDFYPEGETDDILPVSYPLTGKAAGASKLAYFYCAEAASCAEGATAITAASKKVAVPVVYKASIAATAPNYTAQCVAAQQAHVDGLLNGDADIVYERVATDCSRQGYHPTYISSGESFDPSMLTTPGVKDNSWYESNNLPFFDSSNPQIQAMDAAVNKYYPGLVNKPILWSGDTSSEVWASGLLLMDAVKAGGLGPSDTPSAAEIVKGLQSLKGDTLQGLAPPLTFVAGQPNPVHCWFTFRVQNGVPSMVNGGQVTCANGSSS